jgi:hypothetical protein
MFGKTGIRTKGPLLEKSTSRFLLKKILHKPVPYEIHQLNTKRSMKLQKY